MGIWSLALIAVRQLVAQRQRMRFVWAVVAGVTLLLVLLQSVEQGVVRAQKGAVTHLLSGDVTIGGYFKVHPDTVLAVISDAGGVQQAVAPVLPADCALRERGRGHALIWAGKYRASSFLVGVDSANESALFDMLGPVSGSLEALGDPNTVAVSSRLADRLRVGLGDSITFFVTTANGQRNALDGRIVAVTRSVGMLGDASAVVAGNAFMRGLYGYREDAAGALQVSCRSSDADTLAEQLRATLRERGFTVLAAERLAYADKMEPMLREGWSGQRLDVTTWQDESSFLEFIRAGFKALSGLLQLVVLVITVGGMFVSMSIAIRERTRELGTMRAIGMGRRSVLFSLVLEGALTGIVASGLGAGAAVLLCVGLDGRIALPEVLQTLLFMPELGFDIDFSRVFAAVLLVTVGAAAGTFVPAARAMFVSPRSAMESVQ